MSKLTKVLLLSSIGFTVYVFKAAVLGIVDTIICSICLLYGTIVDAFQLLLTLQHGTTLAALLCFAARLERARSLTIIDGDDLRYDRTSKVRRQLL